jgi:hypothetical protein
MLQVFNSINTITYNVFKNYTDLPKVMMIKKEQNHVTS